jgi:polysaccharide biosynthesis protein PslH
MNILFVIPYIPNLIRVRPYNLIKYLSERGHLITLVTVWEYEKERNDLEGLKPFCHHIEATHLSKARSYWNCLVAVPTMNPLQSVYSWSPVAAARLTRVVGELNGNQSFDIAHVELIRGARYGLYLKHNHPDIPVVWDSVDCMSLLYQQAAHLTNKRLHRWITQFEVNRNKRYESWLLRQFDRTVVTSPADRDALISLDSKLPDKYTPCVVTNGVDLSYFSPGEFERRDPATLVISGKMSYHANVTMVMHFLDNILPLIRSMRPDVKVWIVGKDPPKEIIAKGDSAEITVTGTVSDIRPYLQKATIAVTPVVYGAGVQNKVLEAMACGTPVVASPKIISPLETISGRDLLVAEDPVSFADAVLQLLGDSSRRQQIGQNGRKYVEDYHRWEASAEKLEGIYNEVIYNRN